MPDPRPGEPLDRIEGAILAMDALACLVGQAGDLDCAGRDGLAQLLGLLAQEVEQAAAALRTRR